MHFAKIISSIFLFSALLAILCSCAEKKSGESLTRTQSKPPTAVMLHSKAAPAKIAKRMIRTNFIQRDFQREAYSYTEENGFKETTKSPLSTFSVDVDTASYSNIRRQLQDNVLPEIGSVRIEELVNYFDYDYPHPNGDTPVTLSHELTDCPWNDNNQLLHIGLQAKQIDMAKAPQSNLVFLIDVSGSMHEDLELVKASLKMLTGQLRAEDRVAIVVYAGAAGTVLESTPGNDHKSISEALDHLYAGGSTAGSEGIQRAYQLAEKNFIKNGNNRIILATDGDFNVGLTSQDALVRLIQEKREKGIFLTVLGFGRGNYNDVTSESLADHGNGNYAYIDSLLEAKKVLVKEAGGTLMTVAKDVKLQVEFNPVKVKSYRLIGYENRMLNSEDFADDKKDAGDMGAGHTVTALYEIIPASPHSSKESDLRYQQTNPSEAAVNSGELGLIKYRYKEPQGTISKLLSVTVPAVPVPFVQSSNNQRFSAAVAAWGMILRDSNFKGRATLDWIIKTARTAKGEDLHGDRAEFIRQVELTELLTDKK
jgi:Ca-activated chloride channel homolog